MLKKVLVMALVLFTLSFLLLSGERADGAVGNASVTIHYGTNPVEHFSSATLLGEYEGEMQVAVKLPGYTQSYVLSRPCGFLPGWLASVDANDTVTVESPDGLKYIYPANNNHMLEVIKDVNGSDVVTFDYNETDPNLIDTQFDGPDPNLYMEYVYDGGLLVAVIAVAYDDERQYDISYDANRVVAVSGCAECGGGGGFEYEYDANSLLKKVRDTNDPNIVIYEYVYDPNDNYRLTDIYLGEANDSNHIQEFIYTDTGGGNYIVDIRYYTDANTYRVTREYRNSAGIISKRITYEDLNENPDNPEGEYFVEHIVYSYDANGIVTKMVVIPPLAASDDPPDPISGIRKEYTYDPNTGKLLTGKWFDVNDVNIPVSKYTYEYIPDPCGRILDVRVETYTDARGAATYYYYEGNDVDPCLKTMPKVSTGISGTQQLKYEYEYDSRNRVTLEKRLDESNDVIVQTKYEYDKYGNLVKRYDAYGPNDFNEVIEYKYNGFNEMTRMKLPSGVVSGSSYNSNGRLVSEFVTADVNGFDEPNDPALELFSQTRYTYDVYGRVIKVERAVDSNTFTFGDPNDGWVVSEYEYDLWGRRTKVIEDVNGLALETTYKYNNQGEVTQVTLPNGKWTKTYRDGRGLVIKTEVGYGSITVAATEFIYDGNGNLVWQMTPDLFWTKYEYDDFDRLIRVTRGL